MCNFLILIVFHLHKCLGSRPGAQSLLYDQVGLRISDSGNLTAEMTRLERASYYLCPAEMTPGDSKEVWVPTYMGWKGKSSFIFRL